MILKGIVKVVLLTIFIPILLTSCKSNVDKYSLSSCKVVETNSTKCSQLIANDISNKSTNTLSSVDEGDL
jgi:hypothetical protein